MRLIDADELLKKLLPLFNYRIVERDDIKREVDNMPTIEQKHGRWIKKKIGYSTVFETDIVQYVCSECGRQIGANGFKLENFPYCNCGAKMDEVTEDDK